MPKKPLRLNGAYSLVELLIVVGILALLAGILFPVVGRALRRGKLGSEIEQLRQIGVASALYSENHQKQPLTVLDFKGSEIEGSPIWGSGADPFKAGFRNELLKSMGGRAGSASHYYDMILKNKVSFVGFGDYFTGTPKVQEELQGRNDCGWLISFNEQDTGALKDLGQAMAGPFTRLNMDGSVVHRPSQKALGGVSYLWLFVDKSLDEKRSTPP